MNPFSRRLYIILLLGGGGLGAAAPDSTAFGQVLPPVDDVVGPPLDDPLLDETQHRLERGLDRPLDEGLPGDPLDDRLPGDPLDEAAGAATAPVEKAVQNAASTTVGQTLQSATSAATHAAQSVVKTSIGPLRPFVEGVDPFGHGIEEDVLMVLIEPDAVPKLEQSGWPVRQVRRLPSLGLVLVRIQSPPAPSLAEAAGSLRTSFPDAAVDYNFLYRLAGRETATTAAERPATAATRDGYLPPRAGTRLGLIDSAVWTDHSALSGVHIVSRDFAPHDGKRPTGHGTAVASILAANAGDDAQILAASVFFQKPGYAPGATSESLLAALDWLAGSGVDVINMSLAGPADDLLERGLARIAAGGPVVVAAVGNNGPAGEPLYPAAYESALGVTAVDREQRIFTYANRGDHVVFAALGVDVKVANSGGGWRVETGTSMASPFVAAVIAGGLHDTGLPKDALIESLKASAVDLGDEGFDPVFGYGLVQPARAQNAAASLTE
ncbi:MAG TPA: S8 family serine peptidase [Woeseiaceae bacterium]|nr:S8 family serine peptidase [Woeseiaceae bacterium]